MQTLKKGIIIATIIIILINSFAPLSLATASGDWTNTVSTWGSGILYLPLQLVIGLITEVLEEIADGLSGKDNTTPGDVIFNDVPIIDANFFSQSSSSQFVTTIRQNVAAWYYGIRNIAIVASLCVLIYISIRMAISTSADDKGKYKIMFKDWLVSFALVFVLHYIMMFILYGNNLIVDMMKTALDAKWNGFTMSEYLQTLKDMRYGEFNIPVAQKFGANIVCLMLTGLTIAFIIMYMKRFIVIAFLMMIAPLITITYSIDKVKDNKSQAFNTWFKEFFWTVAIQPFHAVIYLVFVSSSFSLIQNSNFASSIMAIVCMAFILQAEDIVKKIFGIQAENVGKLTAASAFVIGGMAGTMKTLGSGGAKAASKPKPKADDSKSGLPVRNAQGANNNASSQAANNENKKNNVNPADIKQAGGTRDSLDRLEMPTPQQNNGGEKSSKVNKALDGFAGFLDNMRSSRAGEFGKKIIKGYMGVGTGLAMAGLSALSDPSFAKTGAAFAGGMAAGGALHDRASGIMDSGVNKLSSKIENSRLKNRELDFDNAYEEYRNKTGFSPEKITEEAEKLLSTNLAKATNLEPFEKKFAESLQNLYAQHEKMRKEDLGKADDHKDPELAVLAKLRMKEEERK